MTDTVFIRGLKVETVIGVHAWEQKLARTLIIDLELNVNAAKAAKSDAIGDALDYPAVTDSVRAFGASTRFKLIETFAERLAAALLKQFKLSRLRISVHKPGAVAGVEDVGVTLERPPA